MWFTALIPVIMSVIKGILPDKDKEKEIEAQIIQALSQIDVAQINVNQAEAEHPSIFVAGWRPFVGWVCAFAFAWYFIVQPVLLFIAGIFHYPIPLPEISFEALITVLMGMLGLGGLRTYEKIRDVTSDDVVFFKKKNKKQVIEEDEED